MSLQRAHCACIMRLSKNNNWHIFLESLIIKKPEEANADPCCNMAEINQWPPSTGQRPNYSRVNYQPCDSLCLLSRPTGGETQVRWAKGLSRKSLFQHKIHFLISVVGHFKTFILFFFLCPFWRKCTSWLIACGHRKEQGWKLIYYSYKLSASCELKSPLKTCG